MKSIVRKMGIVLLALVTTLAFTFVPAGFSSISGNNGGVEKVYAGGDGDQKTITKDTSINSYVTGLINSETAMVGETLSLSNDPSGITYHYFGAAPDRYMQWELWNGSILISTKIATDSDKNFVIPKEASGYHIIIRIFDSKDANSKELYSERITVINDVTDIKGPTVSNCSASTNYVPIGSVKVTAYISYGTYKKGGYTRTENNVTSELYRNGRLVKTETGTGYKYFTCPVSYGKADTFVVKAYMNVEGKKYYGPVQSTLKIKSSQMGRNIVRATKISARKAVIRWTGCEGATGYRIYKGKKKVRNVKGSVTKYVVKGKGAGKAKYRVLPLRDLRRSEGKIYAGKSSSAKPKANKMKTSKPTSWKGYKYGRSRFVVKSISLNGRTYTVKGLFYNSAHYIKVKKYKKMTIKIYADGKRVASKKYRNVSVNLKAKSTKKRTYKIRGKAGADLKYGNAYAVVSVTTDDPFFNTKGKITWTDYGH